jgi:hypothetical protein
MLDDQYAADRIRVNPKWRNGPPRYDYVMYTADITEGRAVYGYAQVLSLFTMTLAKKTYHIAFILDLKLRSRLQFYEGRSKSHKDIKLSVHYDELFRALNLRSPTPSRIELTTL